MKYLEELASGSVFSLNNTHYIISADYRLRNKQKQYMCVSIQNGLIQWFDDNSLVEYIDLYHRDGDNNIIPLKEFVKQE